MTTLYLHTLKEYFLSSQNKGYIEAYLINPKLSKWDFVICLLMFVFITILRFLFSGVNKVMVRNDNILYKLAKNSLLDKINKKWNVAKEGQLYKWKENFWFVIWHIFSFSYNFILLLYMSGYFDNKNGWIKMMIKEPTGKWFFLVTEEEFRENKRGWPFMYTNNYVYYFYILQISYWSSCLFYLNYEIKRKDFYIFVLHHISTIILLIYSHVLNFWRVGLLILLIHDIVDITLYSSKLLNYSNLKSRILLPLFYILFVLSYFFFRIFLYFYYIVLPLSNMKIIKTYTDGFISSHFDVPGGVVLIVFLWALMFMHCYWFYLILRMSRVFIVKTVKNEKITDIRSDNEDDNASTIESIKKEN
ncbi:translocation associated membrane protein, putative [Plasmodium gallinaceum]|uniref:Translocation associated membrane protein, putative n=1 Tax=Plasmodium gallinaceum TaxID=5849 RepID=A0A1J1GSP9_PLAGA|nr:translocation associated membrane protein, putative [Plasmodium gallinaceum]CRG95557.1 translocation associated membrane protein, putative [Plasmodium gallinaceum]